MLLLNQGLPHSRICGKTKTQWFSETMRFGYFNSLKVTIAFKTKFNKEWKHCSLAFVKKRYLRSPLKCHNFVLFVCMLLYQCCALLNRNADNWPLFCLQPSCPVTPGGQASLTGDTPQVIANSPYPTLDRWKQKLVIANSPYPSFPAVMGCENC